MLNSALKRAISTAARSAARPSSSSAVLAGRVPSGPAAFTRAVSSSAASSARVSSVSAGDLQDALKAIDEMPGLDLSLSSQGATEPGTRAIYMDGSATTPTDPRVLDAMMPFMVHQYGNPHSKSHSYGWETEEAVELGRKVSSTTPLGKSGGLPTISLLAAQAATGEMRVARAQG